MVTDKQKLKNRSFVVLRIIISAGILFFLFRTLFNNFGEVVNALRQSNVNYWFIAISFVMSWVMVYLMVLRWNMLLRTQKILVSKTFLFGSYLTAHFFNNFLPTSIGGDIYRIYDSSKLKNSSKIKATTIIFMDRFIGFISSIIFLMIALMLGFLRNFNARFMIYKWELSKQFLTILIITLFFLSTIIIFIIYFPNFFKLNRLFKKIRFLHKWEEKFRQMYETLKSFRKYKLILFVNIMLSFMLQFAFSLIYYFAALGLGITELSLITFIFITQISILLTMLPISIGGIGIREGIFVVLIGAFGGPKDIAAIVSLVVLVMLLIPGINGGIIYAIRPAINKR